MSGESCNNPSTRIGEINNLTMNRLKSIRPMTVDGYRMINRLRAERAMRLRAERAMRLRAERAMRLRAERAMLRTNSEAKVEKSYWAQLDELNAKL